VQTLLSWAAGIAGAGAAYEIAAFGVRVLLERETRLRLHSTGARLRVSRRITAMPWYAALPSRAARFSDDPRPAFASMPLLTPQPVITIARTEPAAAAPAATRSGARPGS